MFNTLEGKKSPGKTTIFLYNLEEMQFPYKEELRCGFLRMKYLLFIFSK